MKPLAKQLEKKEPYFWNNKLVGDKKAAYHKGLAKNDQEDRKY